MGDPLRPQMRNRLDLRSAMTLVELVVVIGIIGVLIGILLPAVQRARDAGHRVKCLSNLRQIGVGLQSYHDTYSTLPPGCSYDGGKDPYPHLSWCSRILPFLEQQAVWNQLVQAFGQEKFFIKVPPHTALGLLMPVFACPADSRTLEVTQAAGMNVAFTSYLGVEGNNQYTRDGVLYLDSKVRMREITDGTSSTIAVGERPPSADRILGWWYAGWGQAKDGSADMVLGVGEFNTGGYGVGCRPGPYSYGKGSFRDQCDAFHFWGPHFGQGANFLFCDGSVHFIPYSAAPIMPALATRAGGEVVTVEW